MLRKNEPWTVISETSRKLSLQKTTVDLCSTRIYNTLHIVLFSILNLFKERNLLHFQLRMLCPNCQECLRHSKGTKCDHCCSAFGEQRTNDKIKKLDMESGDKGYNWICPRCKTSPGKATRGFQNPQALINALNVINDKFELVNKIQIPKINRDLIHLKCVTERIVKQNEEILSKVNSENKGDVKYSARSYLRRRKLNISPRSKCTEEKNTVLGPDKHVGYRTHARSYSFLRTLLRLNRKVSGDKSKRK